MSIDLRGVFLSSLSCCRHVAVVFQDEYADANDPLPEGLIGNLKEFNIAYTEVGVPLLFGDKCEE